MTPEEILGCSMDSVTRVFPHWHCGTDFTGEKKAQNPASKAPSISNIGFLQNLLYPFMIMIVIHREACTIQTVRKI
jgi:hypothetical protein